jgi:hypothetical protein
VRSLSDFLVFDGGGGGAAGSHGADAAGKSAGGTEARSQSGEACASGGEPSIGDASHTNLFACTQGEAGGAPSGTSGDDTGKLCSAGETGDSIDVCGRCVKRYGGGWRDAAESWVSGATVRGGVKRESRVCW